MFKKLTFKNKDEQNTFKKYLKLKGKFLHKQIYDILLEANGGNEVTYYELSSFIRYDKNLRDKLYIYLAMSEEYLRAIVSDRYNVKEGTDKFKGQCLKSLKNALIPLNNNENSNLYYIFEPNFSTLMDICNELKLTKIQNKKAIKDLRNSTMHHNIILFGQAHCLKEAYDNFSAVEQQLNALKDIMPDEYWKGFLSDLQSINGNDKKYLNQFYLEIDDGRIRIQK